MFKDFLLGNLAQFGVTPEMKAAKPYGSDARYTLPVFTGRE